MMTFKELYQKIELLNLYKFNTSISIDFSDQALINIDIYVDGELLEDYHQYRISVYSNDMDFYMIINKNGCIINRINTIIIKYDINDSIPMISLPSIKMHNHRLLLFTDSDGNNKMKTNDEYINTLFDYISGNRTYHNHYDYLIN